MALLPEQIKTLDILGKYPETQDLIAVVRDQLENFDTLTYPDQPVPIETTSSTLGTQTLFRWHRILYPPLTEVNPDRIEAFPQLQIRREPLMGMNLTRGTLAISLAAIHLAQHDNSLSQYPVVSLQLSRDYPRVFAFDRFGNSAITGEWEREEEFSDLFLRSVAQAGLYQRAPDQELGEVQLAS